MGNIIQCVEYAVSVVGANEGNRRVGAGKEEFFVQSKHFGGIGVDYTSVTEDEHSLTDVVARDFVDGVDNALAKCLGWLAVGDAIPVAGCSSEAHDLRLTSA